MSSTLNTLSLNATQAQKKISALEAALAATGNSATIMGETAAAAVDIVNKGLTEMTEGALGMKAPLEALKSGFKTLQTDINTIGGSAAMMLGPANDVAADFAASVSGVIGVVEKTTAALDKSTRHADQFSGGIRLLEREFGQLGIGMGMSFENTQKFTEQFAKIMSFTRPEFFILPAEIEAVTAELASQSVAFEELTGQVDTTLGSMSKMESVIMLARGAGEDYTTTTKTIGKSMMNLGMSFESSIEQYGMIRAAAKETGIQFQDIKSALEGAVSSFEKLGVGMSFAQPIFTSFVSSLEKVGLGIKQATSLTQTFVSAMLNLSESTEKAYLLQSMGGMDFGGGGGIFGAQIGMQAQLLETTDDPAAQADMAMDMAESLKTTLEQFTGGDIVTVTEARDSPELQSTYKIQQELLSQFGISGGKDQARVLEMLQGLEAGTVTEEEVSAQLGDLIAQDKDLQTQTLDEAEKTARNTASLLAQATIGNTVAVEQARYTRALAEAQGIVARSTIKESSKMIIEASENAEPFAESTKDSATYINSIADSISALINTNNLTNNTTTTPQINTQESTYEAERSTRGQIRQQESFVKVKIELSPEGERYFKVTETIEKTAENITS